MAAETARPASVPSVGPYELWMVAQGAVGLLGAGGMMFLIPAYVLDKGGNPADAGAVMAIAGALALSAPFIGNMADRFRLHRGIQLLSLVLVGGAGLLFAFANQELTWLVAATLLGLGMAGLGVVNATFVVAAPFDEETQARKLSLLQLSLPSGQVLGLGAIAALFAAGLGFRGLFLCIAGASVVITVLVGLVNRGAADRVAGVPGTTAAESTAQRGTLRAVFLSQFGISLGLIVLIMISGQAIESQYPNYMQSVFKIDTEDSAAALSVIVLVSIPLYLLAGRWTARSGPATPFLVSAAGRAAAGVGLLLLPSDAQVAALVVFGLIMVVYPLFELNAATLAAVTSPIGSGAGQGAMAGALALGTIIASVAAGWLADKVGFSSLAVITLVTAGAALVLGVLFLRPAPARDAAPLGA